VLQITDSGGPAYRVIRYIGSSKDCSLTILFYGGYDENSIEYVENIKGSAIGSAHIRNPGFFSWKGSYIDTYSINSTLVRRSDWDYIYDSI